MREICPYGICQYGIYYLFFYIYILHGIRKGNYRKKGIIGIYEDEQRVRFSYDILKYGVRFRCTFNHHTHTHTHHCVHTLFEITNSSDVRLRIHRLKSVSIFRSFLVLFC